ncbi:hypothetical protein HK105_203998 [Polyrhizophydium stewartii]|uniref:RNA methyltransferase n=1 Tax=Polyrhizophydium stewartii TaxID=2732419 RepID=A0ABR4NAM0_9FUNG|nr:hypothetical protein HK105_006192 [Polyrhizophydium stewartii]
MSNSNPYLAHLDQPKEYSYARREPSLAVPGRDGGVKTERPRALGQRGAGTSKRRDTKNHRAEPIFDYGNYANYYQRRGQERVDLRLAAMEREWLEGKRVLDIGCNAGAVSLAVGMLFAPALVEGVDIDPDLVRKARFNLALRASLCKPLASPSDGGASGSDSGGEAPALELDYFPESCTFLFGLLPILPQDEEDWQEAMPPAASAGLALDIEGPSDHAPRTPVFPANLRFRSNDWMQEPPLCSDDERFDVVLALSITKWIHLQGGDGAIRHFLIKCYKALRPGGRLILEPQPFSGYAKRTNLTKKIRKNYEGIKFKPSQFADFLLSKDVGFKSMQELKKPDAPSFGSSRPLLMFIK